MANLKSAEPISGLNSLMKNGFALVLNSGATAALGALFWLVAARLFNESEVGRDAALINAMLFLAAIGNLNLGNGLPRFLPQLGKASTKAVLLSYAVSCTFSVLLAIGFVVVVCEHVDSFKFLCGNPGIKVLFVASVAAWNVFSLQDAVLAAVRRAFIVLAENTVFGIAKLLMLIAFGFFAVHHGVLYGWLIPMAVLLIPINYLLFHVALPAHEALPQASSSIVGTEKARSKMLKFLAFDYVGFIFMQASITLLPVIVLSILGGEQNAYFYIAFTVATAIGQLGEAVALQLTVEGAFDEKQLARLTIHTLTRFGMLLVPGAVLLIVSAPLLLMLYGQSYSDNATDLLRMLAAASIPQAILSVWQGVERVRGNAGRILLSQVARAALVVGLIIVLLHRNCLDGAGWGWLIAHLVMAVLVAPSLFRLIRKAA